MSGAEMDRVIADKLVEAFIRLARGDFSVRLARNNTRDAEDTLAFTVNMIAEELGRLLAERQRDHEDLQRRVAALSECFVALAGGDFSARAERTGRGDPMDVLGYLFNNMAIELSSAFEELDHQRHVVEVILESMIDGVLLLDASRRVLRANGAMARLVGRDPASLVGVDVGAIVAPNEQAFAASIVDLVRAGSVRDRDTVFVTAQGEPVQLAVNASPTRDASGAVSGIVLLARDDRQLRRARVMLQMTDRLAAMGRVAASVAHEINNPLAFVMANLDFVAEEIEESEGGALASDRRDEILKALADSRAGADRVRRIVRDLKTLARADQESLTRVDLHKVIDMSVSMIANEVRHHARILKEYGKPPLVEANEVRLGQVFLNLVQNAAHAIPPGNMAANAIRIVTGEAEDGRAFVEVHDTGAGIAEEHIAHIFEAFFTTKPTGVGTGIGLSICHEIVTGLGGTIDVKSRPGEGSVFRVTLPAATAATPASVSGAVALARERRRVLVIDDEADVGVSIKRILGRDHDVELLTRAEGAIALLEAKHFDVVLCDLLMPEMTGMDLHKRLCERGSPWADRMVLMTGGAFSAGAPEFLATVKNLRIDKPFDAASLRGVLDEAKKRG